MPDKSIKTIRGYFNKIQSIKPSVIFLILLITGLVIYGSISLNLHYPGAIDSAYYLSMASTLAEIPETQITIFDVGGSYEKTIKHLGGESLCLDKN